jgi:hypothetical protein
MSNQPPRRPRPAPAGAGRNAPRPPGRNGTAPSTAKQRADANHEILFQTYFKSVNPRRTYAAQVKRATNKNQYLVLTEGKRDDKTDEVRLTRLFLYSEDFAEFFRLMKSVAEFIKANPVPDAVKQRREQFWAKGGPDATKNGSPNGATRRPPAPRAARPSEVATAH